MEETHVVQKVVVSGDDEDDFDFDSVSGLGCLTKHGPSYLPDVPARLSAMDLFSTACLPGTSQSLGKTY